MNLGILQERAKIVSAIRRFFDAREFVEVETAVRIPAPAPEAHIDCPPVVGGGYLRASPELQMKKLLAAGMDKIYQIGPCFREGEKGSRHNPEFTMIEWYRRDSTYLDIKDDLEGLFSFLKESFAPLCAPLAAKSHETSPQRGRKEGARVLRVRDAYLEFAGWDPWVGDWDQDRFDFDMATKIEPAIKEMGGGVFLMDYPPQAASLAKTVPCASCLVRRPSAIADAISAGNEARSTKHKAQSASYAERWEFYWDGMELANCFTELCDRDEQLKRFESAKAARKLLKESDYPIDNEFIESLPRIGSAAGVALGIDRLVMVLTKTKDISAVRADI